MHGEKLVPPTSPEQSTEQSKETKWSILEELAPNFKKFGRLVFDKIGARSVESEEHGRQENAPVVWEKNQQEEVKEVEEERQAEVERLREQAKQIAAQKTQEEKTIGEELVKGMDWYRENKTKQIQQERIQELVERDFVRKILTVETLEDKIADGDPRVSKHVEPYGEKEIPVYTLQGLPFAMLTHTVEYKSSLGDFSLKGARTAQKVVQDPSFWARPLSEVVQDESYGTAKPDTVGNTISMSYTNSETNIDSAFSVKSGEPLLTYGFSVGAGSIIDIFSGDGETSNVVDSHTKLNKSDIDAVAQLEKHSSRLYNEVHTHRYTDEGEAIRPSYIVAQDGVITDTMLQHADFFGIPIVDIITAPYKEESRIKVEKLLESFSESDSYSTIHYIVQEINTTPYHVGEVQLWNTIGNGSQEVSCDTSKRIRPNESKLFDLARIEAMKLVDEFAPQVLEKAIRQCKKATQEGVEFSIELPDYLQKLDFAFYDAHSGIQHGKTYHYYNTRYPYGPDSIDICIVDNEGNQRTIEVLDGENYDNANLSPEERQRANSSHFKKLKPLVLEYLHVIEENKQKLNQTHRDEL